jgi:hypothetical protein
MNHLRPVRSSCIRGWRRRKGQCNFSFLGWPPPGTRTFPLTVMLCLCRWSPSSASGSVREILSLCQAAGGGKSDCDRLRGVRPATQRLRPVDRGDRNPPSEARTHTAPGGGVLFRQKRGGSEGDGRQTGLHSQQAGVGIRVQSIALAAAAVETPLRALLAALVRLILIHDRLLEFFLPGIWPTVRQAVHSCRFH